MPATREWVDQEEWRPVPVAGWGVYEVSNIGRVRRMGPRTKGAKIGRILRHVHHKSGHRFVNLHLPHDTWMVAVSRLMALAFIGQPPTPKHHAAHDDGNPANNVISNIRWATVKENSSDRKRHGTHGQKLTEAQAKEILWCRASGETAASVARRFGVGDTAVSRIWSRQAWKYLEARDAGNA